MGMDRNTYVIAGYDLTGYQTDKYDDWKYTEEGESCTCNQSKGRIQLFDDPMCGNYLYLGYILACGDDYNFDTTKFNPTLIEHQEKYVSMKLDWLKFLGVIDDNQRNIPKYEVIVFDEWT